MVYFTELFKDKLEYLDIPDFYTEPWPGEVELRTGFFLPIENI